MKKIDIVIASYNGDKYIKPQIESIIEADGFDDYISKIIISDDRSTDSTKSVVASFSCDKISFFENPNPNGLINNFATAITHSDAEYIILSDQDDVWTKDKIKVLYEGISSIENSSSEPAIFFTDLFVVDSDLNPISNSFWASQGINPQISKDILTLLFRNVSPGCAMIINRALVNHSLPFPEQAMMHDWWLLLVANIKGHVGYTHKSTVLYRQHGNNVVGTKSMAFFHVVWRFITNGGDTFKRTINQAKALFYLVPRSHPNYEIVKQVVELESLGVLARIRLFFLLRSNKLTLLRNMALFFQILFYK